MTFDWGDELLLKEEYEEAKRRAKPKQDLIAELLADLEQPATPRGLTDISRYFTEKLGTARHRVEQVYKGLKTRQRLHAEFLSQMDTQIRYAAFSLDRFTGWGVGYNTGVDVRRNHLERQLEHFRTERRSAELRAWDDLVRLRRDFREAMEEYQRAVRLSRSISSKPKEVDSNSMDGIESRCYV